MGHDAPGSDLFWPAGSVPPPTEADAADAVREIQSLLPASLRRGTDAAVRVLGTALHPRERPVSVVSGHVEGEPRRDRGRLILVTDQRVLITDLRGDALMARGWREIDSFTSHKSDPKVSALDVVTLRILTSCVYVFRFEDGRRLTIANIGPQRHGFAVGRRIAWQVRRGKVSVPGSARAKDARRAVGALGRSLRAKAKELSHTAADDTGEDLLAPSVTDDDILSHLVTLHDAGVLSEAELKAKVAELAARDPRD